MASGKYRLERISQNYFYVRDLENGDEVVEIINTSEVSIKRHPAFGSVLNMSKDYLNSDDDNYNLDFSDIDGGSCSPGLPDCPCYEHNPYGNPEKVSSRLMEEFFNNYIR